MKKTVNIQISIKDLIKEQNINSTALKAGAAKIRDMVVGVLSDAVHVVRIKGARQIADQWRQTKSEN